MTPEAADALRAAAMRGQREIRGQATDGQGGRCIVAELSSSGHVAGLDMEVRYGCLEHWDESLTDEGTYIFHLYETHGWDFLTIANKLERVDGAA